MSLALGWFVGWLLIIAGAAALGLMLAIYFLLDGFAGVGAAWEFRPRRRLVGLFVGISLFIDGLTLLMLGLVATES